MGALLYARNDGPDEVELDLGRRVIVLRPGQEVHVSVSSVKVLGQLPQDTTFVEPRERMRVGEE